MTQLLHIASLLVQHRAETATALDAVLDAAAGMELALREGGRSIVLFEGHDERALLACMDRMSTLDGVIAVSLVHHHAEDATTLLEEINHEHTT
jgi:nitrate reductase NapD